MLSKVLHGGGLHLAATAAAAAMIAAGSYYKGFQTASRNGEVERAKLVQAHQAAELAAEREYSARLEQAAAENKKWQDFAQAQSQKLAEAYRRTDAAQGRLKNDISAYIEKGNSHETDKRGRSDRHCIGGLDADGLRLYNRALGYPD